MALDSAAYATETRSIILSLDRVSKTAPNGKQILKNVGLGMYLGAKIGVLGQNGAAPEPYVNAMCAHHIAWLP